MRRRRRRKKKKKKKKEEEEVNHTINECKKLAQKEFKDRHEWVEDPLGIVHMAKIWPYWQMVYA